MLGLAYANEKGKNTCQLSIIIQSHTSCQNLLLLMGQYPQVENLFYSLKKIYTHYLRSYTHFLRKNHYICGLICHITNLFLCDIFYCWYAQLFGCFQMVFLLKVATVVPCRQAPIVLATILVIAILAIVPLGRAIVTSLLSIQINNYNSIAPSPIRATSLLP